MSPRPTCPCCGHRTLGESAAHEVCPVCLWEDDGVSTADPVQWGEGPNGISLAEGQARYARDGQCHPDSPPYCARPPRDDEPRDLDWSPWDGSDGLVHIDLGAAARSLLASALVEWCQVVYVTAPLAAVMGFGSVAQLRAEVPRLAAAVRAGDPLSRRDWTRSLVVAETAWVSEVHGLGSESGAVLGHPDAAAIVVLRSVQHEVRAAGALLGAAALTRSAGG